jgi:hypothetical protein
MPTFLILLAVTALAWLFVFFLAPETKGRSLDEVHAYWAGGRRWPAVGETPVPDHRSDPVARTAEQRGRP